MASYKNMGIESKLTPIWYHYYHWVY